jgi:hypothetical protein
MIKRTLSAVPGVVAAFLPNVTCPACWPVYAGVLSSVGLGFLMQGRYFYVTIGVLLSFSLFSLFYKARNRRGPAPFVLGILAAVIILGGKYLSASNYVLYSGAALLVAASVWNNWPQRKAAQSTDMADTAACPHCKTNSNS